MSAACAIDHHRVLALSGGVGGAKLALGLATLLPASQLTIVCNTGDDFDHCGLRICPDLDTVAYTLAGKSHPVQGWGLDDESWQVMTALDALGGETWFRLGDRDIATHLLRTQHLTQGSTLTQATGHLCAALGVAQRVLPMSDQPVATIVETDQGHLNFQQYFVREQCRPRARGFYFDGSDRAAIQHDVATLLDSDTLSAIVICPSNPFVSIDPILALPGMRAALKNCRAPVIAVSPIVGGQALKGPAAKMMAELDIEISPFSVAMHYRDIIDGMVLDDTDRDCLGRIAALGVHAVATQSVMQTLADRRALAATCLQLAQQITGGL